MVITTYNYAHFLADAIRSALAQTADSIEIIVVDDGSTDDPRAVMANFPDVGFIQQPNRGLAAARNAGWQAAQGRYIVFLDADDRLLPHAVATNLEHFAMHPDYAFVFGSHRMIDSGGQVICVEAVPQLDGDAYAQFLEGNCIGMHAAVMYRRDRLAEMGGFNQALRASEDYELYLRIAHLFKIGSNAGVLADYRQHGSNMSLNIPLMLDSVLDVMRRQRPYLDERTDWREIYKRSVHNWKLFYIEKYLGRVVDRSKRGQVRWRLASDGLRIFWLAPIEFTRVVVIAIFRRALKIIHWPEPRGRGF